MSDSCHSIDCSPPGSSVHGIFQAKYWSGVPFPTPGDISDSGMEASPPASPALAGALFTLSHLFVKVWRYSVRNTTTLSTKPPDVRLFQCAVSNPLISSTYNHASETYHITITSIYIIIYDFSDFVYRYNYVSMVTYIILYP